MDHLDTSVKFVKELGVPTLTNARIEKYLHSDGKSPVVVLWNGITAKIMLERLNIVGVHIVKRIV